jgi:hypothetical protein
VLTSDEQTALYNSGNGLAYSSWDRYECDPNDVESLSQCSRPAVSVKFATNPNDTESLSQSSQPNVISNKAINPNSVQSLSECSQSVVTVNYGINPNSVQSLSECSRPNVTRIQNIVGKSGLFMSGGLFV